MMTPRSSPSPGAICSESILCDSAPGAETSMVSLTADAPADVPAITPPRVKISRMRSQMGAPPMRLVMRSWSPPVKNTAPAPFRTFSLSSENASSRVSTCRWERDRTPSDLNTPRYSAHTSSGCSVATVATTSVDLCARAATSFRMRQPFLLSLWPPMMTSAPFAARRLPGTIGTCSCGNDVGASSARGLRFFATQGDLSIRRAEEARTFDDVTILQHQFPMGHNISRGERCAIEHEEIAVASRTQRPFAGEVQRARGVLGDERQQLIERTAARRGVAQLGEQIARRIAARIGGHGQLRERPILALVVVETLGEVVLRRIDVDERAAACQPGRLTKQGLRPRDVGRVEGGRLEFELVEGVDDWLQPRGRRANVQVRHARLARELAANACLDRDRCDVARRGIDRA